MNTYQAAHVYLINSIFTIKKHVSYNEKYFKNDQNMKI